MKIFKQTFVVTLCLIIGVIVGAILVGRYTSRISNHEMVSWDVDRLLHLVWLTEGKTNDVIDVNMKVVEEGITKTDYHTAYPGTKKQASIMAECIKKIYANSNRKMPEHVSLWIEKHER